jgi:hypothetical protein
MPLSPPKLDPKEEHFRIASDIDGLTFLAGDLGLPKTGSEGVIEQEVFESITNPGKLLLLVAWRDAAAAGRWKPKAVAGGKLRHRHVRVIRQYGMSDRREAPQFYPEVKKAVQKTERATAVGPGRVRRRQSPPTSRALAEASDYWIARFRGR